MVRSLPLAVDLNGTLAKSDGLVDAILLLALKRTACIAQLLIALWGGRHALKEFLVSVRAYKPDSIPLREDLIDFLRAEKASGRSLHLVTASPQAVREAVARHLPVFDSVLGSCDGLNLKGAIKAEALVRRILDGFNYAGNDQSDVAVWMRASAAVAVAPSAEIEGALARMGTPIERTLPRNRAGLRAWLTVLRLQ